MVVSYCPLYFFNAIMIYEGASLFIFLFLCIHWSRNNERRGYIQWMSFKVTFRWTTKDECKCKIKDNVAAVFTANCFPFVFILQSNLQSLLLVDLFMTIANKSRCFFLMSEMISSLSWRQWHMIIKSKDSFSFVDAAEFPQITLLLALLQKFRIWCVCVSWYLTIMFGILNDSISYCS